MNLGPLLAATLSMFLISLAPSIAQENMTRSELARVALPENANTEVVIAEIVLQPGAVVPLHTHNGEAFTYIIQGGAVRTIQQVIREDKTGSLLHFARGEEHGNFVVVGDNPIKILAINIGDIGKPLLNIVK